MKFKPNSCFLPNREHYRGHVVDVDFTEEFNKSNFDFNKLLNLRSKFGVIEGDLSQPELRQVKKLNEVDSLSELDSFLSHDYLRSITLNMLENKAIYKAFSGIYPCYTFPNRSYSWFFEKYVQFVSTVCLDAKGFELSKHCDNHWVIGSYVINLKDNKDSTKFWDMHNSSELMYEGPKEAGKGVFFINSDWTRHSIEITEEMRGCLIINLMLNLNI